MDNDGKIGGKEKKNVSTEPASATKKANPETVYGVSELSAAARTRFSVPPELVMTAMKLAGKDKATIAEAERLIKEFKERKVRR